MTFHYIKNYLRYLLCSRHWRGYGVHSPFAYDLVTNVIREELPYYKYSLVEKIRGLLAASPKNVSVDGKEMPLPQLTKGEISPAMGQLLFRLVNRYKPNYVVETKMGLGVSTMYLAAPNSQTPVVTFEEELSVVNAVLPLMKKVGFDNISVVNSKGADQLGEIFGKVDQVGFLVVDDCQTGEDLNQRFSVCLPKMGPKSVVVVTDIYLNESMTAAWRRFQSEDRVRVTVDLFHMGIAFFDENLQKEDYFVRHFPGFHL